MFTYRTKTVYLMKNIFGEGGMGEFVRDVFFFWGGGAGRGYCEGGSLVITHPACGLAYPYLHISLYLSISSLNQA